MTKPITGVTTFDNLPPPWQTAQLDANFTAVKTTVNDMGTYSNPLTDTSGAANAITVPIPMGLTGTYIFGLLLYIKVANTTTSGTVTLDLDGLGPQNVFLPGGGTLPVGALVAGGVYPFMHDGTNFEMVGWIPGPSGANPTASVGLSAVNGAAGTFMRSDGAPALSQAITPTWSGLHNFTGGLQIAGIPIAQVPLTVSSKSTAYTLAQSDTGSVIPFTATAALTVPTGLTAGSAFVIQAGSGVVVTITQGSGMTLQWANGGSSTGNRTLTGFGQATIVINSGGTTALVSGGGLS